MQALTFYEIELFNDNTEAVYASHIVQGDYAPAGTIPNDIKAHAEMLARIFSPGTEVTVSQYWHAHITGGGKRNAVSAEIGTWTSPVMALA